MLPLICDASVALSLVMEDEASLFPLEVLAAAAEGGLHVPAVWPAEVLNALRSNVLRERLPAEALPASARMLVELSPVVASTPSPGAWARWLIELSHIEKLSVYDASYVLLAEEMGADVATGDSKLRRVAERRGLTCLALPDASGVSSHGRGPAGPIGPA